MNPSAQPRGRPAREIVAAGVVVSVIAGVMGYASVAEVVGGGLIVYASFLIGAPLVRRLRAETDPGMELLWNLLLALVVVLSLAGVGVIAAAFD